MPTVRIINPLGKQLQDTYSLPLGGPGSGHWGHTGRPGERGGSQPGDAWVQKKMDLRPSVSPEGKYLAESVKNAERNLYMGLVSGEKNERCYAFDRNGKLIFSKSGEESYIDFDYDEKKDIRNAVLTHSHPLSDESLREMPNHKGHSFSPEDVALAALHDAAEIRAVSIGYVHIIKRPQDGWGDWHELLEEGRAKAEDVRLRSVWEISEGLLTYGEASQRHWDMVWSQLSYRFDLRYERIPIEEYLGRKV